MFKEDPWIPPFKQNKARGYPIGYTYSVHTNISSEVLEHLMTFCLEWLWDHDSKSNVSKTTRPSFMVHAQAVL